MKQLEDLIIESVEGCIKQRTSENQRLYAMLHNLVYTNMFDSNYIAKYVKAEIISTLKQSITQIDENLDDKIFSYKVHKYTFFGVALLGLYLGEPFVTIPSAFLSGLCHWMLGRTSQIKNPQSKKDDYLEYYKKASEEQWYLAIENLKPTLKEIFENERKEVRT